MDKHNKEPNRLYSEKSPYLLQHAYNPVDWFPWGEEAFSKAKKEDKPIFLSIGYSTCHWCHVMAHESFEDPEIAALLNADYIAVKVDREERPDIDAVYMSVCQAITGQGGWPLTIIMTPEGNPFFAATYLPPRGQFHTPGLDMVLRSVTEQWKYEREKLLETGSQIQSFLAESAAQGESGTPERKRLSDAYADYRRRFDKKYGGFGSAPKFPTPHNLLFLLRYAEIHVSGDAMEMVERTLNQMYRGGIFDHLGGGFSRYSTDRAWLVPHFEKMLYDNALLAYVYLEAYQKFRKPVYRFVAEKTLDYMLRELRDETGGFYCGQDADSDREEGKFYLFSKEELENLLGMEDAAEFCDRFGVTAEGNFEGKNVLNLLRNETWLETPPEVEEMCRRVYEYRAGRNRLHKDDKILTAWNGLAAAAFAKAYAVLEEERYLTAANDCASFLSENMERDGRLLARYRKGDAGVAATLDDYAFYSYALLELYRIVYEATYLKKAVQLTEVMVDQFFDESRGGFYLNGRDAEQLIVRPKEFYDGAVPSGNSVAALVLLQLFRLTGDVKWQTLFQRQLTCLAGQIKAYPTGYGFALFVMQSALYPSRELLCACGKTTGTELGRIRRKAAENADLSVLVKTAGNGKILSEIAPFTADIPIPDGKNLFYLCAGGTCSAPTETLSL